MVGIIAFTIFINWAGIIIYGLQKVIKKKVNKKRLKKLQTAQAKIDKIKWSTKDLSTYSSQKIRLSPIE